MDSQTHTDTHRHTQTHTHTHADTHIHTDTQTHINFPDKRRMLPFLAHINTLGGYKLHYVQCVQ